jgi:hypothetical protein
MTSIERARRLRRLLRNMTEAGCARGVWGRAAALVLTPFAQRSTLREEISDGLLRV